VLCLSVCWIVRLSGQAKRELLVTDVLLLHRARLTGAVDRHKQVGELFGVRKHVGFAYFVSALFKIVICTTLQ